MTPTTRSTAAATLLMLGLCVPLRGAADDVLAINQPGSAAALSPDRSTLLYTLQNGLSASTGRLRELSTGAERPLLEGQPVLAAAFAPGGKRIVALIDRAPRTALMIADAATGHSLGALDEAETNVFWLAGHRFSPDGATLYLAIRRQTTPEPAAPPAVSIQVTPAAAHLATAGAKLDRGNYDDAAFLRSKVSDRPTGPIDILAIDLAAPAAPRKITTLYGASIENLCVAPDGKQAAIFYREAWQHPDIAITLIDLQTPAPAAPQAFLRVVRLDPSSLRWLEDSRRIVGVTDKGALMVLDTQARKTQVIADPRAAPPRLFPAVMAATRFDLPLQGGVDRQPTWSPSRQALFWTRDGVLFQANLSADPIVVTEIRPTPNATLDSIVGANQLPDIAADGSLLVSSLTLPDGSMQLSRIDLARGQRTVVAETRGTIFPLACDGKTAWFTHESGDASPDIAAVHLAGAPPAFARQGWLNPKLDEASYGKKQLIEWRHPTAGNVSGVLLLPAGAPTLRSGKYPLVILGYPQIPERWGLLTYDTPLLNLPRALARQGIGTLMPTIPIKRSDAPDANQMIEINTGVQAAADAAIEQANVDPNAIGLAGASWGGYMVHCAITQTDRFRAAVSGAGFIDPTSFYIGSGDSAILLGNQTVMGGRGGPPWAQPERYTQSSPLFQVNKVTTPVLLFCSADDQRVPPEFSRQAFRALSAAGRPAMLLDYPKGGHYPGEWPAGQKKDLLLRLDEWFVRLLVKPNLP